MRTMLGLLACIFSMSLAAGADAADALPLVPAPAQAQSGAGWVEVGAGATIAAAPGDAGARAAADYLAELLRRSRGLQLKVAVTAQPPAGAIRIGKDAQAPEQAEGYALDADASGIRIDARSDEGLFYGAISLWQLLSADGGRGAARVPEAHLRDWPRFRWRGLMLDVARHYQSPDTIKLLLDAMAEHKLNVFHWHLTDDQGWRLQIKRYPKLTDIGAWRTPPGAGTHGVPPRYGGFYSQAQVREIVAYAAQRHITVVPELDMPGHAQAAVAAYPELVGVDGRRPQVSVDWGVNPYLYNVDDGSFRFIENVLDEVMALFPSTYIHVGGDEAIKDQWKASAAVQAKMRALGINSEDALQSWFIERIGRYLAEHGRRLIGWDEILEGGLPASASVMSWRGVEGAIEAAKKGHDVVLAPSGWVYLDNLQSQRGDEPSARKGNIPLSRVYGFEPVDASLSPAEAGHVLGVEAALWTELMPADWNVRHAIFPRIAALAEIAWSPKPARDWQGFLARMPAQWRRYRSLGIEPADAAFAPAIELPQGAAASLAASTATVKLENQTSFGRLRYTTDGSVPGAASAVYAAPFTVKLPATVRAAAFADDGTPLSAPRSRVLDRAALLSLRNGDLRACPDGDLGLRAPLLPDLGGSGVPAYDVDLFHACWIYPQAALDTVTGVRIEAARLARNYALAHDQSKVVAYPAQTAHGELEVRRDRCDGPVLARLPLPAGDAPGVTLDLRASLPRTPGVHDLCLRSTAPIAGPLYGIGAVHLLEGP